MSQEELAAIYEMMAASPYPDDANPAEMRVGIDAAGEAFPVPDSVDITPLEMAGLSCEWTVAKSGQSGPAMLYLHGGGYIAGSLTSHRNLVARLAEKIDGRILTVDYRLAPEHPFPAAVVDGLAAYEALLDSGIDPNHLTIGGDSAGGGLTMATLVSARDKGLPMPAGALLFSPWTDLTASGATIATNAAVDPTIGLKVIKASADHYLAGAEGNSPLASPIFADLRGMPPVFIQTGAVEVLLSDSETLRDRLTEAGSDCQLEVWDKMFHVWHAQWPILSEARDAIDKAAAFVKRVSKA